jgi:hypothetical protein
MAFALWTATCVDAACTCSLLAGNSPDLRPWGSPRIRSYRACAAWWNPAVPSHEEWVGGPYVP